MRSLGLTHSSPPVRESVAREARGSDVWRETLGAAFAVLVAMTALVFVLIVLPWVISI